MATTLDPRKNFALAVTATPLGVSDISWTLDAGQGANLPDTADGAFNCVIWDQTASPFNPLATSREIVRVVTRSGDTISSMTRAQEGTTAIALTTGPQFAIAAIPTKKTLDDIVAMIQEQQLNFGISSGTNTLTMSITPNLTAYLDGARFVFKKIGASTAAVSMNIDGVGARNVRNMAGQTVYGGALKAKAFYEIVYDDTASQFRILSELVTTSEIAANFFDTGTCTGGPTAYVFVAISGIPTSYYSNVGSVIRFVAPSTNTGGATISVLGGVDNIVKKDGAALVAGDIKSGDFVELTRITLNGDWQLMSAGVGVNINGQALVTAAPADEVLIADTSDSNNSKKVTVTSILSSGIGSNFASAYDTNTQTVSVADTFQDITFSNNLELDGWTHTATSADFVCPATKKYLVTYSGKGAKTTGSNSLIEIIALFNGTEVAGSQGATFASVNNSVGDILGSFVLSGVATQILKLQLTGGTVNSNITAPAGNATTNTSVSIAIIQL